MKQVVFIKREKGCDTLSSIIKNGELISIVPDPFLNGFRKYYKVRYPESDKRPLEVTILGNTVVSVRRVPESILKTLPPLNPPQFGNF